MRRRLVAAAASAISTCPSAVVSSDALLLEGGGSVLGSFFDRRLVDQVAIFLAPRIIGGRDAAAPVAGRGHATVEHGLSLEHAIVQNLGEDYLLEGYTSG